MGTSYLPVQWIYREVIEEEIAKSTKGKVFYFGEEDICEAYGSVKSLETTNAGVFLRMDDDTEIRIDRIITLFGKPSAAYDEYDAFANACLDCLGGYTKDELDNM